MRLNGNAIVIFLFGLQRQMYLMISIPQVITEIERLPGILVREVNDAGPRDETNVYVTFEVSNKGPITLYNPTRLSVLGQESLIMYSINDCIVFGDHTQYIDSSIRSVEDLVKNYDAVYEQISSKGGCMNR
jgi:hypothetical protein